MKKLITPLLVFYVFLTLTSCANSEPPNEPEAIQEQATAESLITAASPTESIELLDEAENLLDYTVNTLNEEPQMYFKTTLTSSAYTQDLTYLSSILEKNHPNFNKAIFNSNINSITAKLNGMDDTKFNFEIRRLLAGMGDAHTYANLKPTADSKYLPIWQISKFDDGWYILGIKKEYEECIGKEIVAINGVQIDEIFNLARPYISHENKINVEFICLQEIKNTSFLKFLGVISNTDTIPITLMQANGKTYDMDIKTLPTGNSEQYTSSWAAFPSTGQYNKKGNYYYTTLDNETFFIQYSKCEEDNSLPIKEFQRLLISELRKNSYKKVIFDLRYNNGGMFSLFEPVLNALGEQKGKQNFDLYCMIDNATFSTGVMHAVQLKNFGATLVGRPTRGKPNFYANTKIANLPNSSISVYYSTGYMETMPGYKENSLNPDIFVVNSYSQFANGIDCDVEAIRKLT